MKKSSKKQNPKWLIRAEALKSLKDDKLFKDYYEYVKNLILSINPPFVLGISGEWGRGKTTLFNFLEKDLSKFYVFVRFESWKYQRTGNLSYAFVENLISKSNKKRKSYNTLLKQVLKIGQVFKISLPLGSLSVQPDFKKLEDLYKSVDKLEDRFQKLIKEILKSKKGKKLIILIDDLDRCLPEFSLEFLENIKHFFSVEDVIFLISLDEQLLETALNCRYNNDNNSRFTAKVYLEKIVDLFIKLPHYQQENLKEYLVFLLESSYLTGEDTKKGITEELIKTIEKIPEIEKSSIMTNPRKLDRIVKNFRIAIRSVPKDSIIHKSYPIFFLLLVLREYYYEIFKLLKVSPTLIFKTWSVKTGKNELRVSTSGTYSIGTPAQSRESLNHMGEEVIEFYKNFESSNLAVILVEVFAKEYDSGKFGKEISRIGVSLEEFVKEIDKYLF